MYDVTTVKAIIDGFNAEKDSKQTISSRNSETDKDEVIKGFKEQIDILKKHDEEQKDQVQKLHELID